MNILWDGFVDIEKMGWIHRGRGMKKRGEIRVTELIEFLKDGFFDIEDAYDTIPVEEQFYKDGTVYIVAQVLLEVQEPDIERN